MARYADGAAVLRAAIAVFDTGTLRKRPIAGKMSTLEVLCHIVDADQFMCDRMKRTIATEKPLLMGVDGITYLEQLHYHERDPELELRLLEVQREQMLADLSAPPRGGVGAHLHPLGGRRAHAPPAAEPRRPPPRVARRRHRREARRAGAVSRDDA